MKPQFNFNQNDGWKTMLRPFPQSIKKYIDKIKYAIKLNKIHNNNKFSNKEYYE